MDVLFNQPRNAGSSTSLTTSFALVLNFPHPPSTLTTLSFMFVFYLALFMVLICSFYLEDWGFREFSFTSALSYSPQWGYCWWCSNHSVSFVLLLAPVFNHGNHSRVFESAERPKWPSPMYHSPCRQILYAWYLVAAVFFFTASDLTWAYSHWNPDGSVESIHKTLLLVGMQKWHPETDRSTAPEKEELDWVAFWFVREVQ